MADSKRKELWEPDVPELHLTEIDAPKSFLNNFDDKLNLFCSIQTLSHPTRLSPTPKNLVEKLLQ